MYYIDTSVLFVLFISIRIISIFIHIHASFYYNEINRLKSSFRD